MAKDWKERLKRIQEANKKTSGRISMSRRNRCAMCGRGWKKHNTSRESILDNQLRYCKSCARKVGKI